MRVRRASPNASSSRVATGRQSAFATLEAKDGFTVQWATKWVTTCEGVAIQTLLAVLREDTLPITSLTIGCALWARSPGGKTRSEASNPIRTQKEKPGCGSDRRWP